MPVFSNGKPARLQHIAIISCGGVSPSVMPGVWLLMLDNLRFSSVYALLTFSRCCSVNLGCMVIGGSGPPIEAC